MLGSPPQVRGKRVCRRNRHIKSGITPAGAGKTVKIHNSERKPQDHPRRCGENKAETLEQSARMGSPPQVRGKRESKQQARREVRITPAGAGKTYYTWHMSEYRGDHPRRCGEN